MYRPKIVKCRLKTGGKTIPEIREQYKGQGLTYRDLENVQRANEQFDGALVLLSLWEDDNYESYHLFKWDEADDEKMMMGMYYAEQTNPFPCYIDRQSDFIADWKAGNYELTCVFCFQPCDVEEIEVISEEVKEDEKADGKEKEETPPPRPRARPTKKKYRRRKK